MVEGDDGTLRVYKSATTPSDPVQGILDAFVFAAEQNEIPLADYLGDGSVLMHGTTRGLNAVLTGSAAKTAMLVTEGHPDILVLREVGAGTFLIIASPIPSRMFRDPSPSRSSSGSGPKARSWCRWTRRKRARPCARR